MPVLHSLVRVPQLQGDLGNLEQRNAVEFCNDELATEEWIVQIGNEGDTDESAAAISARQVSLRVCQYCFGSSQPDRLLSVAGTRHTILDVR